MLPLSSGVQDNGYSHWYRSVPGYRLRVFFSSSIAGLDLMLDRENRGLVSNSIPVDHLLQGRWGTNQSISQLEMGQFESELRTRESMGMGETSTVREQDLHEKRLADSSGGSADVLCSRLFRAPLHRSPFTPHRCFHGQGKPEGHTMTRIALHPNTAMMALNERPAQIEV